jgi:hypothetical protein
LGCFVSLLALLFIKGKALGLKYEQFQLAQARRELFTLEKQGHANQPAHQILNEAEWIADDLHDLSRLRERVLALQTALSDPANIQAVDEQSAVDGSWGKWYTEWFFKLDASYGQIIELADHGLLPKYPLHFLDQINSPAKLIRHLDHLLVSDSALDGVDHRRELNETIADLMRLILRNKPSNYAYDPQLKAALLDWLLHTARDPVTGYWGQQYLRHNPDRIEKTADLSMTFHIISYLQGDISNWAQTIATTLAIKDQRYPNGWLGKDGYFNHNNMDVVRLFSLGWSQATPAQRDAMRVEIHKMLDWCLHTSLQPDGSFKLQAADDSVETSVTFGADFLVCLGYFDRTKRFWTDEDFPEAADVKTRIVHFIQTHLDSGGEGGVYYRSTLSDLGVAVAD